MRRKDILDTIPVVVLVLFEVGLSALSLALATVTSPFGSRAFRVLALVALCAAVFIVVDWARYLRSRRR